MMIKNTTPITKAQSELDGLGQTHAALAAKRETLAAELAIAKGTRREMLIGDAAGPETLKAERKCSDLESRLDGVDDALSEIGHRQAAAQAALDAAQQDERRAKHADELDRSAAVIDNVLGKVVEAGQSIAAAIRQIEAAVPQEMARRFGLAIIGHERADAADIALAVVGTAVGARLPETLAVTTALHRLGVGDAMGRQSFGTIEIPDIAADMRAAAASLRGEGDKPAPILVAA